MRHFFKLSVGMLFLFLGVNSLAGNKLIEWSFLTGGKVYASPVIRNDILYIGSLDSNFYAIDAITGNELWRFNAKNQILTTAVIYKDIICFESGNILYGLSINGDILWKTKLYEGKVINQHDQWDCFRSSPELFNSIVYIGFEEGLVFGINIITGEQVFEAQTPQANASIETTPAIYSNKIFVGDWLGVISAFDLKTSNLLWQYDTKDDNIYEFWVNSIVSQPLIYNDKVYFGGRSCNLYCLDPETGEKIWMYHQPEDKWIFGGPVESENVLYTGSSLQEVVYAFDADTPKLKWEVDVSGLNYGMPLIYDNYVIVGTAGYPNIESGSLSIVDKQNKVLKARFVVKGWVQCTPAISKGIIYFGCADGNIYAINMQKLLLSE